jgi:hypothetical protein
VASHNPNVGLKIITALGYANASSQSCRRSGEPMGLKLTATYDHAQNIDSRLDAKKPSETLVHMFNLRSISHRVLPVNRRPIELADLFYPYISASPRAYDYVRLFV